MAASTLPSSSTHPRGGPPQRHLRNDRWWLQPAITATILFLFIVYSTWRAFENAHFFTATQNRNYISPFYSPCVAQNCPSDVRWFSINIAHWISPALYILIFPLGSSKREHSSLRFPLQAARHSPMASKPFLINSWGRRGFPAG